MNIVAVNLENKRLRNTMALLRNLLFSLNFVLYLLAILFSGFMGQF